MFEKESKEYENNAEYVDIDDYGHKIYDSIDIELAYQKGAEFGYNNANEWHYVKDGDLPRQDGHTCFSIEVLANNKKWVYYQFTNGKWFCGNKEVKVIAWKEIVLPKESK